jgi:hypothetical protein
LIKPVKLSEVTNVQARKSAFIVAFVLLLIGLWNLYRGRTTVPLIAISIGGMLILMALLLPALTRRFHVAWIGVAGVLGWINSRLLLSLVFYILFVPYNLVSRLIRRDPLNRRKARRESYWIPRETTRQTKGQFERLF